MTWLYAQRCLGLFSKLVSTFPVPHEKHIYMHLSFWQKYENATVEGISLAFQWLRLHLPRAWCGFDPWSGDWDATCFPAEKKKTKPETIKQRQCCSKFKAILEDKTSAKPSSPHLLDYIYYTPQPHKFPDPRSGLLFSSFIYLFVRLSGSFLSWCQAQQRWNK